MDGDVSPVKIDVLTTQVTLHTVRVKGVLHVAVAL